MVPKHFTATESTAQGVANGRKRGRVEKVHRQERRPLTWGMQQSVYGERMCYDRTTTVALTQPLGLRSIRGTEWKNPIHEVYSLCNRDSALFQDDKQYKDGRGYWRQHCVHGSVEGRIRGGKERRWSVSRSDAETIRDIYESEGLDATVPLMWQKVQGGLEAAQRRNATEQLRKMIITITKEGAGPKVNRRRVR